MTASQSFLVDECWELLRQSQWPAGRCGHGHPDIFPINYAVDHGSIVIRTAARHEGSRAPRGARSRSRRTLRPVRRQRVERCPEATGRADPPGQRDDRGHVTAAAAVAGENKFAFASCLLA